MLASGGAVIVSLLGSMSILTLGASLGGRGDRPRGRTMSVLTSLLAAPLPAATTLRLAQDASLPALALGAGLAGLAIAQVGALMLSHRVVTAAALALPASGLLMGTLRSHEITRMAWLPLGVLVLAATPITLRALMAARRETRASGMVLVLGTTLFLGTLLGAGFLWLRVRST